MEKKIVQEVFNNTYKVVKTFDKSISMMRMEYVMDQCELKIEL